MSRLHPILNPMDLRKLISHIISMFLGALFLSSCTLYQDFPLEVLRAGESRIPSETGKIGWLYRNFRYTGDTLQHYYRDGEVLRKEKPEVNLDSLLATTCMQSAARDLRQNSVEAESLFFPADMMPPVSGEKLTPLPAALVQKLARPAGADRLMVLETFSWFYSRFRGETRLQDGGEVTLAGIWACYDGTTGAITETRSMVDTVYWSGGEDSKGQSMQLPPRVPALEMAATTFGERYAQRFYASWITVDRLLVIPPIEEFRQAADHALQQEWEPAMAIWQRYSADRFGRLAITARYNLALAAETIDHIEKALHWIRQAEALARSYKNKKDISLTSDYRQILETRQKEIARLESWGKQ